MTVEPGECLWHMAEFFRLVYGRPFPLVTGVRHPMANLVFDDADGPGLTETLQAKSLPALWMREPMATLDPCSLGWRLRNGRVPAMVLTPDGYRKPRGVDGAHVWRVGPRDICTWTATFCRSYDVPREVGALFCRSLHDRGELVPFLVEIEGSPVGTAILFDHGASSGVYCVAVEPRHRGRGLGKLLTSAAVEHGFARGHRTLTLQSTRMGETVYMNLGFQSVGHLCLYEFRP